MEIAGWSVKYNDDHRGVESVHKKKESNMNFIQQESEERAEFDKKFDKKIEEIIILTEDNMSAGKGGQQILWNANISTLAYIDTETNELIKGKKVLEWLVTEEQCYNQNKIFNLQKETIYRLKVRKSLPFMNEYTHEMLEYGKSFTVVDVIERNCSEPRLEEILKEYQRDVIIHPQGCNELLLDKSLGMFCGKGNWNGEECWINLDCDEGKETAVKAIETLQVLLKDCQEWDQKARQFASEELTDLANDWAEDKEHEVTLEEFQKRIKIDSVNTSSEQGCFEIYYDDDMFCGHVIIVSGNILDGFDDASIAG